MQGHMCLFMGHIVSPLQMGIKHIVRNENTMHMLLFSRSFQLKKIPLDELTISYLSFLLWRSLNKEEALTGVCKPQASEEKEQAGYWRRALSYRASVRTPAMGCCALKDQREGPGQVAMELPMLMLAMLLPLLCRVHTPCFLKSLLHLQLLCL